VKRLLALFRRHSERSPDDGVSFGLLTLLRRRGAL